MKKVIDYILITLGALFWIGLISYGAYSLYMYEPTKAYVIVIKK